MCFVSTPLPAALAVLPRWSDVVVRAHCSIQALSASVAVIVFCFVATEPRSACRRLLCATAVDDPPSRRTSAGSNNHVRLTSEQSVVTRLFHVEMSDFEAAVTPPTPTTHALDVECLLPRSTTDVTAPATDDNKIKADDGSDAGERHPLSPLQGVEQRCYEPSNTHTGFSAAAIERCQRTRLLVTTANFPDDVAFAHTSV